MNKGKRFTERMKFNGVKYEDRGDCNIICYHDSDENDPIDEMAIRLCELEDMLDDGELVSKDWHDEQVLHAENVIEEQKAEIEKLLCKNAELEVRCEGVLTDYYAQSKTCDEQRVEIERLKDENCHDYHCMHLAQQEKAELQKQVDELSKENARLDKNVKWFQEKIENGELVSKQAIKDTAKEILSEIGKEPCEHHYLNWDCEWFDKICKKYGVEVE